VKPATKVRFAPAQIHAFRLRRHHLLQSKAPDPVTIAHDIAGVQAQVMGSAYLAFWARNHQIRRAQIEAALWQERSLVRTALMRQTLHLIPSAEFSIYTTALRESRTAAVLRVMARCSVTPAEASKLTVTIMKALERGSGTHASIEEAARPMASAALRGWMDRVWSIVRLPVAEGLVCYGPGEGNTTTFVRTDQWLGKQRRVAEEEARVHLLRAYLRAYGPAGIRDFAHWSGMPMPQVKPLPALLGEELAEVEVDGSRRLLLRADADELASASNARMVALLPGFDPYLLAHAEKGHFLHSAHYKKVYRNQGWISNVVLIDGHISGVWSYEIRGSRVRFLVNPFARLSVILRNRIAREFQSMADFLGRTPEIAFRA